MENLKTQSKKQINYVLLFLAGLCIGYGFVRGFVLNKLENGMLLVIGCCLLAGYSLKKE